MVKRFVLQWHLTERCNLKCLHCYQEDKKLKELDWVSLEKIFNDYLYLLEKLKMKGHINITGGEPLCSPYLFKLLDLIKEHDNITFSILTNGTLITDAIAQKISSYNPYYVQVSMEGGKGMNDYIRGKGSTKKIQQGIKNLKKYGLFTSISFTASSLNYQEFPKVVKFAIKNKIDNVWSDRYIPLGDNADKSLVMNQKMTEEYLDIMFKERMKRRKPPFVSMNRALQFQKTNDYAYGCTAGDTLLTVMEDGTLVPCRRMPINIGNLKDDDMYKLYKNSKVLKTLRKEMIPKECKACEHSKMCHGGLKCLTYALYNDFNHKDIGCNM